MKRKSRWVKGSDVPRYTEIETVMIQKKYHEQDGWHRGARVTKRKKP